VTTLTLGVSAHVQTELYFANNRSLEWQLTESLIDSLVRSLPTELIPGVQVVMGHLGEMALGHLWRFDHVPP
jgi:hypothetical protein